MSSNVPISSPYGNYSIVFQNNQKQGKVQETAKSAKQKSIKKDDFVTALENALDKDSNSSYSQNNKEKKQEQEKNNQLKQETFPSQVSYFVYNKEGNEIEIYKKSNFDISC